MTPAKRRKANETNDDARAPKAAALLAQAPAAVRATITVLANSPVAGPSRPRQPPVEVPASEPEPSFSPETEEEPEEEPAAAAADPSSSRSKPKRKKATKRKTLTTKGKRAVILKVLATVEAERTAAAAAAAAAAATATTTTATEDEAKRNLGKAWNKEDLAKLARLAQDKEFLQATIPDHPDLNSSSSNDLDWELISSYFGRFSKGGVAVKQQYYAVVRLMKQARGEGKKGSTYMDLVKQALMELPENKGTVYDIHAVLKKNHAKHLDKYKVKGQVRWKKAVGEVLRQESTVFEVVEKTESGKIIWKLK
jgi:hypothetical protein